MGIGHGKRRGANEVKCIMQKLDSTYSGFGEVATFISTALCGSMRPKLMLQSTMSGRIWSSLGGGKRAPGSVLRLVGIL